MALRHEDHRAHRRSGEKHLGLTTADEQAWCRWYGAEAFDGGGAIVEWGAWLGSLTTSYCEGLALNPRVRRGRKVAYAYDLFRWEPWCEAEARGSAHAGKLVVGETFVDYFRALHAPFADLLEVRAADLTRAAWSDGPIALLLNDAVKTLPVAKGAFAGFLPALVPGEGLLANQDYLWPTDSFLALPMYLMRDALAYEYTVPDSCMVIFRCTRTPDPGVLAALPDELAGVDPGLLGEAFAWSRRTVAATPVEMIDLGNAVTLWQGGFHEEACRLARERRLGEKRGALMYDFQLDALAQWGYGELLAAGSPGAGTTRG
jgi:hypothetical protein